MTEEQVQKLIELHLSDMTLPEIAQEFGVSLVTIKRRIAEVRKKHHIPYRNKSTQKTNQMREQKHVEETPWNLDLGRKYITTEWRV